jgi:transposase
MARPATEIRLNEEQLDELREFYRHVKDARYRTRAQMVLLAAEQGLTPQQIATIVQMSDQSVRNWIRRYRHHGLSGLLDRPRPGAPHKVTAAFFERLLQIVRLRPRSLDLPFSVWTLERLKDFMANETGIDVHHETIRRKLNAGGVVLSRPQHKISSPDPEYLVKKRKSKGPERT